MHRLSDICITQLEQKQLEQTQLEQLDGKMRLLTIITEQISLFQQLCCKQGWQSHRRHFAIIDM